MNISPLRVSNEEFLVSSLIERCPKSMMLRELVKNGLEAASQAPEGRRRVELGFLKIADAFKLAIWNTGPGMDAEQLYRMCDLASSIGKEQALDGNFGMGAKVASLPSNQYGIRYRSCKDGHVHQVIMGKREGVYGRVKQTGPGGALVDVIEVTDEARAEGRSLDGEWTEVVLLGNREDQSTLEDPYDGNPKVIGGWINRELRDRFYRIPKEIEVVLGPGTHPGDGPRLFTAIGDRFDAYARHEAVEVQNGIVIHYVYDANDPKAAGRLAASEGAIDPTFSYAAVVYRDEIYDLRVPYHWLREAPIYGITFGARNVSIHIELPDDYPLLPDAYRQFLRHTDNLQKQVEALEFAPLALEHRPQWLLELLKNFAPDSRHIEGVRDEMYLLFKSLGVRRRWWPKEDKASAEARAAAQQAADGGGGEPPVFYEAAPQILSLTDPSDIAHRGMNDNAARFYPETHQLFVNSTYPAFGSMRGSLEQEFATIEDQEAVRGAVHVAVEQTVIRQICRKLAHGLAKREIWQAWQVDAAVCSYSLTLAADDQADTVGAARRIAKQRLGLNPDA